MSLAATTVLAARMMAAPLRNRSVYAVKRRAQDEYLGAFDAYADALFRHACLRLASREQARDATQDAFIKAWDYIANGHEVREWKSFLYRVLNNLIIDEYRRTKNLSLDALVEEGVADMVALEAPPGRREREEALDEAYAIEHVRKLIEELPEPHRSALILRYVDGLAPKEVAEACDISENAASVRIHRAVARLKTLCEEHNIII